MQLSQYQKMKMMAMLEHLHLEINLKIENLPWGRMGLTICFDLRFQKFLNIFQKKNLNFIINSTLK